MAANMFKCSEVVMAPLELFVIHKWSNRAGYTKDPSRPEDAWSFRAKNGLLEADGWASRAASAVILA